jgi:hypothetical protein
MQGITTSVPRTPPPPGTARGAAADHGETNNESGAHARCHGDQGGRGPGVGEALPAAEHSPAVHGGQRRRAARQRMRAAPGQTTAPKDNSATITVGKAGAAGATVTFAVTAGSLPPGLTSPTSPTSRQPSNSASLSIAAADQHHPACGRNRRPTVQPRPRRLRRRTPVLLVRRQQHQRAPARPDPRHDRSGLHQRPDRNADPGRVSLTRSPPSRA